MTYTINQGINYIFASVYANWTGYNVSIIEVDHLNNDGKFLLHSSVNSDMTSIEGIADIIRPVMPLDVRERMFIGTYFNKNIEVAQGVWKLVGLKGGYLLPPRDIETALCSVSLKINSGKLLVASELTGVIHADIQKTKPDDIPFRIQSLVQVSEHWGMFKIGGKYPDQPMYVY
jgi:hypothetical protein